MAVTKEQRTATHYSSPLRYPGGKAKVANYLKLLLLENGLTGCEYFEPYAGGASVAFSLLFEDFVDHIHINDLNRGVHAFWWSVLTETDELCELVSGSPLTVKEWGRQKKIYRDPSSSGLELGFATFYLNRTNRSGIIARGGVIGGLTQSGAWKMDARFNRDGLCARIRKISRFRNRVTLTCLDASALIKGVASDGPDRSFLYLDPPYYVKGEGLYDNFYTPTDHALIAAQMSDLETPWLVSYDATPEILSMYGGHQMVRYSLSYSAARNYLGTEAMFLSPDLVAPDTESPARVSSKEVVAARMQFTL